jgi:hypothetical protein
MQEEIRPWQEFYEDNLARPQKQREIQRNALIQRRDLELFELAVRHFVGPGA